jgi:hypothetical protein
MPMVGHCCPKLDTVENNYRGALSDAGARNFNALGANGINASGNVTFPFSSTKLGAERLGSGLSVAVDPSNGNKLFVAFDVVSGGSSRTVVVRPLDGGQTWIQVFTTSVASDLPALSVSANDDDRAIAILKTATVR